MYTGYIIKHSTSSNYSPNNQRDILLDLAGNLTQIGTWTLQGYTKQQENIKLYLKLIGKDVDALKSFPETADFNQNFDKCCRRLASLMKEYQTGIIDHRVWAKGMLTLGDRVNETASLV